MNNLALKTAKYIQDKEIKKSLYRRKLDTLKPHELDIYFSSSIPEKLKILDAIKLN